jgi:hypothetical protein
MAAGTAARLDGVWVVNRPRFVDVHGDKMREPDENRVSANQVGGVRKSFAPVYVCEGIQIDFPSPNRPWLAKR